MKLKPMSPKTITVFLLQIRDSHFYCFLRQTISLCSVYSKPDGYVIVCEITTFIIVCLFCLNACLMYDHQSFVQSIQGQECHGQVNHDIAVGRCSKLLMRLSYCFHL